MTNRLLKFEKQGCTPCTRMQNLLDSQEVEVERIDAFEHPDMSAKYDIGSVPTLILVDEGGNKIQESVGFKEQEIEKLIAQL